MPLASAVAAELRQLADSLDRNPEASIPQGWLSFSRDWGKDDKDKFLNVCRLMPRPATKKYTETSVTLTHATKNLNIYATIDRSEVCEIIEPARAAVYNCSPILSAEEDAELEAAHAE